MSGHLKNQRCIATRYDKTALSFGSFPQSRRHPPVATLLYQQDLGRCDVNCGSLDGFSN